MLGRFVVVEMPTVTACNLNTEIIRLLQIVVGRGVFETTGSLGVVLFGFNVPFQ